MGFELGFTGRQSYSLVLYSLYVHNGSVPSLINSSHIFIKDLD